MFPGHLSIHRRRRRPRLVVPEHSDIYPCLAEGGGNGQNWTTSAVVFHLDLAIARWPGASRGARGFREF